jgi:hypothetical protein
MHSSTRSARAVHEWSGRSIMSVPFAYRELMALRCEATYFYRAIFQDMCMAKPGNVLSTILACCLAIMLTWQPSGVGNEMAEEG